MIEYAVLGGFVLDCLFGDPAWLPHPVVRNSALLPFPIAKPLQKRLTCAEKRRRTATAYCFLLHAQAGACLITTNSAEICSRSRFGDI